MTYKINSTGTAAVSPSVTWQPIDANTPRGVKLQLISKSSGIAMYGTYSPSNSFYTHWAPLPTFAPNDVHGIKLVISTDLLRRTIDLLKSLQGDSDMAQFECWDMINLIDELEAQFYKQNDSARHLERIEIAAREVVARWDTMGWKDETYTGDCINELRAALQQLKETK